MVLTAALVGAGTAAPAEAAPNVVAAAGSVFVPGETVIVQGTGLTFVNLDTISHDVTANEGGFSSQTIGRGTTKVTGVEDLTPNTYSYYCTVHDGMWGLLTVLGPVDGP